MIQRYEFYEDGMMIKQADGEYVKYEDHIDTVRKLEKEMSEIRAAEAEAFMLMEQAERKYMEASSLLENVACLAHGGGLIDLSEAEVLTAIRKLSISSFIQKLSAPLLNESLEVADAEYKNFSRKNKTT